MSTVSSLSSLLNSLNPSNESIAQLLGESTSSNSATNNASTDAAVLQAVDGILNSATNTSGTGLDVTSTVDAILQLDAQPEENLQSQVTALNSQTSALQSIETDLSNLQTAVQALNDPMGVFGDITVASTNNNVVSATAANGTAAGSHSIVVNSLATTSTVYSAPEQTEASALPAGEFDIQVGNNTAVPVPVDTADNTDTLGGLATYINQQNLGVTASVITDSSGARLSLASQTSGSGGVITVSADTTGADLSGAFSSASATLPTGSFDLQVGSSGTPVTISVDSGHNTDTLAGLASYINQNVPGVTASVITNASGAQLALVPQSSGQAGTIIVSNDNTGTGGNGMGFAATYTPPTVQGMTFTAATDAKGNALGTDASLTVDGVPVTSSSNTLANVIPGLTLTLSGTSSNPVTLDVQPDLTQVASGINNFVSAWNQLMSDINAQNTYNGTGTAPPLLGDPALELLQSDLLAGITTSVSGNGPAVNLQSIGIQLQEDGTLKVQSSSSSDSMDLNDALANNFSAVQNLFQSASPAGVSQTLNTSLINLTDAKIGPLNLDMGSVSGQVSSLNDQISEFQYQLRQTQAQLTAEYSTINTTLEQLPELINQVNQQLDALNPPKSS